MNWVAGILIWILLSWFVTLWVMRGVHVLKGRTKGSTYR